VVPFLNQDTPFPDPPTALSEPNGLLAAGADLSPERLLLAYRQGIFPWFGANEPILWWCPDPRMVLYPEQFEPSRSLRKTLRNGSYEVRVDFNFAAVIEACAAPREGQSGTWIQPDMVEGYCQLHRLGHAHSFETWIDNQLVGGLYGVAVGGIFFGESMFARVSDASKIAFSHLVAHLRLHDFKLLDCQFHTAHLATLKAREIPRHTFLNEIARYRDRPLSPGPWSLHENAARDTPWQSLSHLDTQGQ